MALPFPGTILQRDLRHVGHKTTADKPVKLLQWNIERGYQLPGVIEELRAINADVISLQEVDVGCERSCGVDTGLAIAEALQLNYLFLCEFQELHSPLRDARSQGGGVHGNAILTKFDVIEAGVVEHRMHPVDWDNPQHPLAKKEPRRGRRAVLRATLRTPQGPLVVYCAHLEVFCGMLARVCQLADIFRDARAMVRQGYFHQAILGDLNTMAHGIARLSPNYCMDEMRFRSIGLDEAVVWERYVLSAPDPAYDSAHDNRWAQQAHRAQQQEQQQTAAGSLLSQQGELQLRGHDSSHSRPAAAAAARDVVADAAMLAEGVGQDLQASSVTGAVGAAGESGPSTGMPQDVASTAVATEATAADAAARGGVAGLAGPTGQAGAGDVRAASKAQRAQQAPAGDAFNAQLVSWGLSMETAREALNPGFSDPFPAATTVTLDNPAYRWLGVSLMRGKLDWVLLRRLRVLGTAVGNHNYRHSDHKWLAAEVTLQG